MKKSNIIILIIGAFIVGFLIGSYVINSYLLIERYKSHIEKPIPTTIQSNGTRQVLTNDAVPFTIQYSWALENSYSELDTIKTNLVINRTIAKFFTRYSSKEINAQRDSIMSNLSEHINDCIFALHPIGFNLTKIMIIPEIK